MKLCYVVFTRFAHGREPELMRVYSDEPAAREWVLRRRNWVLPGGWAWYVEMWLRGSDE